MACTLGFLHMSDRYDPPAIETAWQARWSQGEAYHVSNDDPRPKSYVLCMYPYPSGPAHQGHVRNYTFGDLNVRYRTMNGDAVLSPIGFDSFGLPAEMLPSRREYILVSSLKNEWQSSKLRYRDSGLRTTGVARFTAMTKLHSMVAISLSSVLSGWPGLSWRCASQLVSGLPNCAGERTGAS